MKMELKPTIKRIHQVLEDGLQAYDLNHKDDDPFDE